MGWNDHVEDFGYGTLDTHVCSNCVVDAALRNWLSQTYQALNALTVELPLVILLLPV